MNWLILPLTEPFMQKALLAVILVGATCSVLGAYVVLRRMAFIGDAIAHTTLPGIVLGFLCGANLFVGALIAALITAMGIGWLSRREAVREDTAIGVIFTGMFALGVLIVMKTRLYRDFSSILFGNPLAVTPADLTLIATIAGLVLVTLVFFHKELELTSVDPNYAATVGLRSDWMRNLLLILLAMTVVTGLEVVGVILTSALLITPAAAASLLTRNLVRMMLLAMFFSISGGIIGLYASRWFDLPSGATIVIACTGWFIIAFAMRNVFQRSGVITAELATR